MSDRRLRIALPSGCDLDALADLIQGVGGEVVRDDITLSARFLADAPGYLEDRVEAWLNLIDPSGTAILSTARGEDAWEEGWRARLGGSRTVEECRWSRRLAARLNCSGLA